MAKKIADKDTADFYKAVGETWIFTKQSELGMLIEGQLKRVEDQAIKRAMYGDTPDNINEIMEGRGAMKAVKSIRMLFADIEKDYQDSLAWIATNDAKRNQG